MSGLYNYAWQQYRISYLHQHPLCVMCLRTGKHTAATVVDHIVPHKDNYVLFWDTANHQALCKICHDAHKQHQDRTGSLRGAAADGTPLDPNHHWNAA